MNLFPPEILLHIANYYKNPWKREDFLKAYKIDNLYYGKKNPRPLDRRWLSFKPRRFLATRYYNYDGIGRLLVSYEVSLPIPIENITKKIEISRYEYFQLYSDGSGRALYDSDEYLDGRVLWHHRYESYQHGYPNQALLYSKYPYSISKVVL